MQHIFHEAKLALSNLIFPPRCVACGVDIVHAHRFCSSCYGALELLSMQKCYGCGYEADRLHDGYCYHCLQDPLDFKSFHAACRYNDFAASLVGGLKFGDQLHLAPAMAQLMLQSLRLRQEEKEPMMVVPVPMHYKRRWRRRYNQSAELARHIAKSLEMPYVPHIITRYKATKPQLGQTGASRRRNLKNAFRVEEKLQHLPQRSILLIDDVVTTGSTIKEISKSLAKAGYKIHVLVFARVDGVLH